jgi:hypothetical protein
MRRFLLFTTLLAAVAALAPGQTSRSQSPKAATAKAKVLRTADGHPDLSGLWSYAIDLPPTALKKEVNGKVIVNKLDQSARHGIFENVPGALPYTDKPSYKPEFVEKVKYLAENESKTDRVFYCGKPGTPRIGSPRRIVQLPNEMIFLYEDISGDPYRVIPTDGRPHRKDPNPSAYGDSVGHWEGDVLVVDSRSFSEDTWFGEDGYFHSDAMRVLERFWRDGENLIYQVTVEDPKVLTAPFTMAPHVIKPSNEPLEESPACIEDDAHRLTNNDHHGQR